MSVIRCAKMGCTRPLGRVEVDPFTAAIDGIGVAAFLAMSLDEQVQFARMYPVDAEIRSPELITDWTATEVIANLPTGVLGGWLLSAPRTGTKAHIPLPAVVWCISGHPNDVMEREDGTWTATKALGLSDKPERQSGTGRAAPQEGQRGETA